MYCVLIAKSAAFTSLIHVRFYNTINPQKEVGGGAPAKFSLCTRHGRTDLKTPNSFTDFPEGSRLSGTNYLPNR